jgi:hypothetical protein
MNSNISSGQFGPPTTPKQKEPAGTTFAQLDKKQVIKRINVNNKAMMRAEDEYGHAEGSTGPRPGTPMYARQEKLRTQRNKLYSRLKDAK